MWILHTVCATFTEIDIYVDMDICLHMWSWEKVHWEFCTWISHVSSWPQSPEAHRTVRELFLPLCHALPLLWWSVWQFLHFLNTLSHGCWGSYTEMKRRASLTTKTNSRYVAKTGIICHLQVSFEAKHT